MNGLRPLRELVRPVVGAMTALALCLGGLALQQHVSRPEMQPAGVEVGPITKPWPTSTVPPSHWLEPGR
ncbi:hypothetical protein [Nocardia jejuensis]|uniref:hypothetical protein n=1 Tax=Nocardia jejuensis TaxID=328049 RepID=UPI00082E5632|nr:hypothetical protein [Nocardia jejuensis]